MTVSSGQGQPANTSSDSGMRWMPTAGGILSIIAGAGAVIGALILGIFAMIGLIAASHVITSAWPAFFVVFLALYLLAIGALAITGGIAALHRKSWGLAVAGAIAAVFSGGTVIGVTAIVFIALSKKEFAG